MKRTQKARDLKAQKSAEKIAQVLFPAEGKSKKALLTVRLTEAELQALKSISEKEGLTMSDLVRERIPELSKSA
ncbi:MAG: hypothetical protein WCH42_07915 [Actinomycetes bacterium]